MTTTPVLIPIPNLGAGTDPPNPAADLVAVSQNGVARKLTINELLDGAHPVNWTVDYLTVIHDANVGGTLGVTGTGTFAGSLIAGNAGTAPITLQSGIISMPASQSLQIRLATAGQTVSIGAPAPGLGQALTITPNTNGNNAFGALPNDVAVNNRLTFTSARTIGGAYALSGTVTPTAITGNGATITVTFPIISGIVLTVGSSVTLSGVTPSGYNGTRTILTASNTQVTLSGSATGTVTVLGSMTYNLLSPQVLNVSSSWSGTPIAGVRFAPYRFLISSDTAATDGIGQGAAVMEIAHNWLGAATGGKLGMQVSLSHTGTTNDTAGGQQHVVANLHAQSFFNAGGTGTGNLAHGTFYGTNPQIRLNSGATYWKLANVLGEMDLAVNASQQDINLGGTVTAGNVVTLTFASSDIVGSPVAVSWTLGAGQTLPMVANNLAAAINASDALRNARIGATGWEGSLKIYYYTHISTLTITPSVSGGATITAALGAFTSGASVDFKTMASFIRLADDDAPGSLGSALMVFGTQYSPSPVGQFEMGIAFNGHPAYSGSWSFSPTSTLIGSNLTAAVGNLDRSSPMPNNTSMYGIDWFLVNFTRAGGRSFRSSNFGVGGEGNIYSGGAVIAPTSAGLSIDVTGRTASSVALAAGGGGGSGQVIGNYFIGDIGFDDYNGQYRVTGVNAGTGAVTTFAVESPPSYSSGSAPANPIMVNGGSGRNWTVNATWPGSATLALQASGGDTSVIGKTIFGATDFRRMTVFPVDIGVSGSPQILNINRVGSDATVGITYQNLWVTRSAWTLTDTTAPAGTRYNTVFETNCGAGVDPGAVWSHLTTLNTAASEDSLSAVTSYIQAVRSAVPGGGKIGVPLETAVIEFRDSTNASSATGGIGRTIELDMFVNGADDYVGAVGREVMPILLGKANSGGTSPTITSLIGVYPVPGDGVTLIRGITFANQLAFSESLWDTRDSVQGANANAIWLKAGHTIALDGTTVGSGTPPTVKLSAATNNLTVTAPTSSFTGSVVVAAYVDYSVGNALTAVGTTRANALQLAKQVNNVTTAAAGTGVILPVGVVGMRITVFNAGANPIKVYASASETVDGTAGSTGVTLTNALRCDYFFVAANTWVSAQLGAVSA